MTARPRVAARAILLHEKRLLLVNAWPEGSDLLCAPGGGVELGSSLPENLQREVYEETGLSIEVGSPVLINEFHDPDRRFHQIEVFFRCTLVGGDPFADWTDPEGVVSQRYWLTRDEMRSRRFKPASLLNVAWSEQSEAIYDPLEPVVS